MPEELSTLMLAEDLETYEAEYITNTTHGSLILTAVARLRDLETQVRIKDTALREGNAALESMRQRLIYLNQVIDQRNSMVQAQQDERDQLHAEVMEQARLLGMSGEKELALMAEIDRLRKDAERHGR